MELKRYIILFVFTFLTNSAYAELLKPNKQLEPYDVVKIQLEALKNNNEKDNGIKQTWLFAHPNNKKITGPYERFRVMIYGQQYKFLINHSSHKIKLVTNDLRTLFIELKFCQQVNNYFFTNGMFKKEVMRHVKIVGLHLQFHNPWTKVTLFETPTFYL